ncbi:MAG: hypothetical protein ABWX88_02185 [Pseudoxanthomonas sp.]
MNHAARVTIALTLAAMTASCNPSQPSTERDAAQSAGSGSAATPVAEPPPPMPEVAAPATPPPGTVASATMPGSMIVYACEDGSSVTVTYDKYSALVKLPTGSTTLSRAESLSGGGDEAYLSEELSLYRNGNLVQLQSAGKTRACSKALGSS